MIGVAFPQHLRKSDVHDDPGGAPAAQVEALGDSGVAGALGGGRTATISELPSPQVEVSPVFRTSGVGKPRQVQPLTVTGAPPPLPRICPVRTAAAYEFSTRSAVAQETGPSLTLTMIGTFTPVLVAPQVWPTLAVLALGVLAAEVPHPASTPSPSATPTAVHGRSR